MEYCWFGSSSDGLSAIMGAVLPMEKLPLGFRFRPTDEELINHYLRKKINGKKGEVEVIPEVDICRSEPCDLPGMHARDFPLFCLVGFLTVFLWVLVGLAFRCF